MPRWQWLHLGGSGSPLGLLIFLLCFNFIELGGFTRQIWCVCKCFGLLLVRQGLMGKVLDNGTGASRGSKRDDMTA